MDLRQLNLNPAQLQMLMNQIQFQSQPTTSQPTGTQTDNSSSEIGHVPSMPSPIPPVLPPMTIVAPANPIGPYQGVRMPSVSHTPQGHPSMPSPIPPVLPPATIAAPANPIGPYQSVRMPSVSHTPQGHPSQAMMQMSTSPMQPFLGRDSLAISMSDQVNQQRRGSAANHPRQPRLPSRGRRRGPAVQPPSLPRRRDIHQIEDCLSTPINNGISEVPIIRIKVKVYPPTVRTTNCLFFCFALRTC
jgi:hypothetical protein